MSVRSMPNAETCVMVMEPMCSVGFCVGIISIGAPPGVGGWGGGVYEFRVHDGFDVAGVDDEFQRCGVVADADFDARRAFAVEERDLGEELYAGVRSGGGLGGGRRR